MVAVRSMSSITDKWVRVTPQRTQDYQDGVTNPKKDWQKETEAAKDAYKAGVQEAINQDRFAKGVKRAGTAKWQEAAKTKGADRFGPGVMAGGPAFTRGFEPFRTELELVQLPPKGPKGDIRNYERVKTIGQALHKKKLSLLGA